MVVKRIDKYCSSIIFSFLLCLSINRSFSQSFDSAHVYAIHMNTLYYVSLSKDLIKTVVDPFTLNDEKQLDQIFLLIENSIKQGKAKKTKNQAFDLRLYFEFFKDSKVAKEIGFTGQNTMFTDNFKYLYKRESLIRLDTYISGLSATLGIK